MVLYAVSKQEVALCAAHQLIVVLTSEEQRHQRQVHDLDSVIAEQRLAQAFRVAQIGARRAAAEAEGEAGEFELDPGLGASINHDAFAPLVRAAKDAGVERFIYASSSSVYGIKDEENVTEDLALEPLTDYSKFKALCEE